MKFIVEPGVYQDKLRIRVINEHGFPDTFLEAMTRDDCLQLSAALAHAADGTLIEKSGIDEHGLFTTWNTVSPFFQTYVNYQPPSELELLKAENAKLKHDLEAARHPKSDLADLMRKAREDMDRMRGWPQPPSPYTLNPTCGSGGVLSTGQTFGQQMREGADSRSLLEMQQDAHAKRQQSQEPSAIDLGPHWRNDA